MKKRMMLLLLPMLLGLSSCEDLFGSGKDKEPETELDKLPPLTTTGENTFGYLLNGKAINITNTSKQLAIYQGGNLQFGGGGVYINIVDPLEINITYDLIGNDQTYATFTENVNPSLGCIFENEDVLSGIVYFANIDRVNFIVSGTFEYTLFREDCDTVKITNGRFDLKYIP